MSFDHSITDQVSNAQHLLELRCHWIVLHGHEQSVEDDADSDGEVEERVHDKGVEQLLEPTVAAIPLQEDVSKGVPAWRTGSLVLFKI